MNRLAVSQGHSFYTLVAKCRRVLVLNAREINKGDIEAKVLDIVEINKMDWKEVFKAYEDLQK
jgi:hypothetical protein